MHSKNYVGNGQMVRGGGGGEESTLFSVIKSRHCFLDAHKVKQLVVFISRVKDNYIFCDFSIQAHSPPPYVICPSINRVPGVC